nr:MAG TPA: hypothetical protein [Caudoviricetes sp.]
MSFGYFCFGKSRTTIQVAAVAAIPIKKPRRTIFVTSFRSCLPPSARGRITGEGRCEYGCFSHK